MVFQSEILNLNHYLTAKHLAHIGFDLRAYRDTYQKSDPKSKRYFRNWCPSVAAQNGGEFYACWAIQ